jgi:hypothetical protein
MSLTVKCAGAEKIRYITGSIRETAPSVNSDQYPSYRVQGSALIPNHKKIFNEPLRSPAGAGLGIWVKANKYE